MSFKKNFFKNLIVSGGYLYVSQLTVFFASFVTSRLLLPSDFGLVGLITVFSGFISIFSDSGISLAVIRTPYHNTFYRGLNAVSLWIGITLTVLTLILIYPIAAFYKNPQILAPGTVIAFLFIVRSFITVPMAVLQKNLQFARYGKILLISTLCGTVATIIMAYFGLRYWSLVLSQYVTALVNILLLHRQSLNYPLLVRKAVAIRSFTIARTVIGGLTGFNIINYWARNSDNLIVGKFYGAGDLGIYNRAYMMLQMPLNLISGLFTSVLFPSMVQFKNAGGNVEEEYYFILKIISLVNLPVALILIIFPEQFVTILWGKNWLAVASLLPYFGLLVMIQTLFFPMASMLVLEKKEKSLILTGWIASAFMIGGIIYGSTISLISIAAFYSLSYIVLVLPFNLLYNIKRNLHYSGLISFWLPKAILCFIIWLGIYNHFNNIILVALLVWTIITLLNLKPAILKVISMAANYRLTSRQNI